MPPPPPQYTCGNYYDLLLSVWEQTELGRLEANNRLAELTQQVRHQQRSELNYIRYTCLIFAMPPLPFPFWYIT